MQTVPEGKRFQSAVSAVKKSWVGHGTTRRSHDLRIYYLAERDGGEEIDLRRLSPTWVPIEDWLRKTPVAEFRLMRPEPLIYFNKVLPAMKALETALDKGDSHLEAGRHDRAAAFYREAAAYSPDNVRACFGLGLSSLHLGEVDNAQRVLGQILELDQAFSPCYKHLFNEFGISLRRNGLHREALKFYVKAMRLGGSDEHLLFNVARLLYDMRDFCRTACVLDKALRLNPEFDAARRMRSRVAAMADNAA